MITEKIQKSIIEALKAIDIDFDESRVIVELTKTLDKGDYTTNIAMILASKFKLNPRELAQKVVDNLEEISEIEKIEVAGPGFINFYLSDRYLLTQIQQILSNGAKEYVKSETKEGKNILIEYTDANPFKVFHIGHLYTNAVGESFARLQETTGANVKRANYQGDIGLHVAKTMWGIKYLLEENNQTFEDIEQLELSERVEFLGEAYMTGAQYYDDIEDPKVIEEIQKINSYLSSIVYSSIPERKDEKFEKIGIKEWYRKGRMWCLEQFEILYKKLGTKFDYYFFESKVGEIGYNMVKDNVGKIFKEDDGAVIYEGDPDKGLHTRVFINQFGLPTYEAKELGLAKSKSEKGDWDESVMITDKSQNPYFKVVLDALSKLEPEIANAIIHMSHGVVALPGMKKMSSRKGEVISAEELLEITQEAVINSMKKSGREFDEEEMYKISEKIAVSAIKYAFLRVSVGKNIAFDVNKDIKFEGDTGPYLMYVYTRARSIIESADETPTSSAYVGARLTNTYIKELVRQISRLNDIVLSSSINYSPSTLCTYLFELGQIFNKFYQEVNVLNSQDEDRDLLLAIVNATAESMKEGLYLLGIDTVSRM
ncbi:MAG: Arginine--tRNA ligase [candidate division WS6 bacterium 34_10]|uniref:Arginine--tRNA ligase n=1 Tax=candidate division WS6 bacterium 34_10 TaxID=1641389 RepID=A0A117LZV0_9BACT|nr:MAG: Arginine--tRNA ligase [candidate division WS6 bacterium 34_10]